MDVYWQKRPRPRPRSDLIEKQMESAPSKMSQRQKKLIGRSAMGLFLISTTLLGATYMNYQKSLHWSENKSSLKMADMPIDTLTDTGAQAQAKEHFVWLANKAIAPNGQLQANAKDMKNLKKALDKVKTSKSIYRKKYDKVYTKYMIRKKLNSLFAKKNVLKKSTTPAKVYNVLDDISPELNTIYIHNHNDAFVHEYIKEVRYLVHDTNIITSTFNEINGVIKTEHGTMTPVASLTNERYNKIYARLDKVHYTWLYLDKFKSMQDAIQDVLEKQGDKINSYNNWQGDLKAKRDAYAKLAKMREDHKKHYYEEKAKKAREKQKKLEEEQRAREEAEREREEEKRREEQERQNEQSSNSSDSNSKENNSSSSSSSSAVNNNRPQQSQRAPSRSRNNYSNNTNTSSNTSSNTRPAKVKKPTKSDKTEEDQAVNDDDDDDE